MTPSDDSHLKILAALKHDRGKYVSGTQLAARLKISRTAVWKHVRCLQAKGYQIQSHPKNGYLLADDPDLLIPEELTPLLHTTWLGQSCHHFMTIGSTNDYAMQQAVRGAPHGAIFIAEEQTGGRGRMRRPWISHAGTGIYVTIILRSPLPPQQASQPTLLAALALVRIFRENYGVAAGIKWPNDVLIGNRKVSGILTEMQSEQDLVRFMAIGVGVNVNQKAEDFAGPLRYPATSLALELKRPVDRKEALAAFLGRFEEYFDAFLRDGFGQFLPALEDSSAILNKSVTIQSGTAEISGVAAGFTEEGGLRIKTPDGNERLIWVGDVTRVTVAHPD